MFGGLEVKGNSNKKDENSSGFSFMNSGATAPAQTPGHTNSASGFSFMATTVSSPAPVSSLLPGSGFSFMKESSPPVTQAESSDSVPSPSGFSFMGGGAAAQVAVPDQAPSGSGFSFMATTVEKEPAQPPNSDFVAPSHESAEPAGAGVTFGGASAQKKAIKRRTRVHKVGGGTASYSLPAPLPASTQIQSASSNGSADASTTKEQAEEAVRRAEEFLQTKMQEQSRLGSVAPEERITNVGLRAPTSHFTAEVDDELEEAMRAAKEAEARLAKEAGAQKDHGGTKSTFGWLGGGFRKSVSESHRSGESIERTTSGGLSIGATALAHAVITSSRSSSESFGMIPTPNTSQHETPADRILREQEEIKKAMAERHLKMAKQEEEFHDQVKPFDTSDYEKPRSGYNPSWSKPTSTLVTPSVPVWGVKAPAPPPPTPHQLMDILLEQFAGDVSRAMDRVDQLRTQRNMLLEERFVALAKQRLAAQQIVQTEAQQLDAAEREDFELADRLQVVLDGHNREKAECTAILENISRALAQLDQQTPGVIQGVALCFENIEEDLRELQKKEEKADKSGDTMDRLASTARQLSSEDERLKTESKSLEREEELAMMERKELDAAIHEQTAEIEAERDQAKSKLDEVEKEMDELREKLRLKEGECHQLRMKIDGFQSEISRTLVNFTRQITRVERKEKAVSENRKEWELEKTAYEKLKAAYEAEVKAHSEALLQHSEVIDTVKIEIKAAFRFRDIIANEVNFDHTREDREEADGDLAQLQADVVKCEAAVTEAAQLVKNAEAMLVELDGESKRLLEQVPKLEEAKKVAAAKRDFKGAGKASKDIKEATARLKELEDTLIDEAKVRVKEAKLELDKMEHKLEEEKAKAYEKERDSGRQAMSKIAERIQKLLAKKKEVCGKAKAGSVKKVGANVLKRQIEALKLEGQTLGEKFGGWEELMLTIDEEEPEEEEEKEEVIDSEETGQNVETPSEQYEEKEEKASSRPDDEVIPENVEKARMLTKKLAAAERSLSSAVEEEDYEKAAELDDVFKALKTEIENMDLTNAEMELALAEDPIENADVDDAGAIAEEQPEENEAPPPKEMTHDSVTEESATEKEEPKEAQYDQAEENGEEVDGLELSRNSLNGDVDEKEEVTPTEQTGEGGENASDELI